MYENEIKNLEWLKCETSDEVGRAIDTAIALMRAAQPKDEAEERERVDRIGEEFQRGFDTSIDTFIRDRIERTILRERAAVRAECAVETQAAREKANADAHAYADEKRCAMDDNEAIRVLRILQESPIPNQREACRWAIDAVEQRSLHGAGSADCTSTQRQNGRAAQPKDEAAEEHACLELLPRTVSFSGVEVLNAIKLGRAAVRAECADEIKFLRECGGGMRAEIERLKSLSDGLARAAATLVADNSTAGGRARRLERTSRRGVAARSRMARTGRGGRG
jgi:hypothetical protein